MFTIKKFSNRCNSHFGKKTQFPLSGSKRNYYGYNFDVHDVRLALGGITIIAGLICYAFYEHKQYKKLKKEMQETIEENQNLNKMLSQFMQREKLEQELQETKEKLSELKHVYDKSDTSPNPNSLSKDKISIKQNLSNVTQSQE